MNKLSSGQHAALEEMVGFATERQQAGDLANAELLYGKILQVAPSHAVALHNLGLIYLNRGDCSAASVLLSEAVNQNPSEATFHYNLGLAYQQLNALDQARRAYEKAVRLAPSYRAAWENLGVVLQDSELYEEALQAYRRAFRMDPDSKAARDNIGVVLRVLGRVDEALDHYKKALGRAPLDCDLGFTLGATLLSVGRYQQGWALNEWRYWSPMCLEKGQPYRVPLPKWDGSSLSGRHLLVYGEQGIGDEIMAASCLDELISSAAKVTLLCERRLVPIFSRSFPEVCVLPKWVDSVMPILDQEFGADVRISLDSVPKFLRPDESCFDGSSYLKAEPGAVTKWQGKLNALGKTVKVGVSWRGGADSRAKMARSLPLQAFHPLFEHDDIAFVNIQYGNHADEIDAFNAQAPNPLVSFPEIDPLQDMDDFAALLAALDLVISVDNSTVHLAGALGVPTWVMLPAHADWRWLRGRHSTGWYSSVKLFWQEKFGPSGWQPVLARLVDELGGLKPRGDISGRLATAVGHATCVALSNPERPLSLMLNDTGYWDNWGNSAACLEIHDALKKRGYRVESVSLPQLLQARPLPSCLEDFDRDEFFEAYRLANQALLDRFGLSAIIVVNGEGYLAGFHPIGLSLLYLAYMAKTRLGKNVQIINHSCFPHELGVSNAELADAIYAKVYGVVDSVVVRDNQSAAELARLGVTARAGFDCLPLYLERHPVTRKSTSRRVVVAGMARSDRPVLDLVLALAFEAARLDFKVEMLVGGNAYLASEDVAFVNAIHPQLKDKYTLVAAQSESEWMDAIASADLLVTAGFHHAVAAAFLGTPMLVMAHRRAEMLGLLEKLELAEPHVVVDEGATQQAMQKLRKVLAEPELALVPGDVCQRLTAMARRNFEAM